MRFKRITLTNWKNFASASIELPERAFLIGPNASGKSNFLDAFRFLRDLAVPSGGLQRACEQRGGVSKIRCLSAKMPAGVTIAVELVDNSANIWYYEIAFTRETQYPKRMPVVLKEIVRFNNEVIIERPDSYDKEDRRRLSQTALEQINANQRFRVIADSFNDVAYLHLVPQMIRDADFWFRDQSLPELYGGGFLERIANTSEKRRRAYLRKIQEALKTAVPQFDKLALTRDDRGIPHLEAVYKHWRSNDAGRQNENQFSDGTLRLIGLLWMLQDGSGLLLMEEPELYLHKAIVSKLAPLIFRAQARSEGMARQIFISTHSVDLLDDPGIDASELIVFHPGDHGTHVEVGSEISYIKSLMENGIPAGEAAIPFTAESIQQLTLFEL